MYEISYIDAGFRANILYAIDRYEALNPGKRIEDVRRCREITNAEYHTNAALTEALKTYLTNMVTGFNLFGLEEMHVNTGHSMLKSLIFNAFKTRSAKELLDFEQKVFEKLKSLYREGSREKLIFDNKKANLEISMLKSQNEVLEGKLMELERALKSTVGDCIISPKWTTNSR